MEEIEEVSGTPGVAGVEGAEHRYEISALIGPCTEKEATDLMLELHDAANQRLGAVFALERVGRFVLERIEGWDDE